MKFSLGYNEYPSSTEIRAYKGLSPRYKEEIHKILLVSGHCDEKDLQAIVRSSSYPSVTLACVQAEFLGMVNPSESWQRQSYGGFRANDLKAMVREMVNRIE